MAANARQVAVDLPAKVRALMPELVKDLIGLVEIPSVSQAGSSPAEVLRAGEAVASLLQGSGINDVRFLPITGDHGDAAPLVYANHPCAGAPVGTPTVLLYAHYDVQPAGAWADAFEPRQVDQRLFGRGAADDKSGIMMHLG
ncbi:MAG: M20/M25/M40 family metallo-hydrolase, partial [Candidatus Dormibacteria bacterium]